LTDTQVNHQEKPAVQRLFFALWPDASTATALRTAQQTLCQSDGRPLHPEDLHLTLVFLGDVVAGRLPCVQAAADQVSVAPFELTLTQHGYWRGPRVSWLAPDQTPQPLSDLVDQLWTALADCGFTRESRPFSAHLTLARKARPVPTRPLATAIPWRVDSFVLAASGSGGRPPRYRQLGRWALAVPAAD
jgi:2'-5' RNA ligase